MLPERRSAARTEEKMIGIIGAMDEEVAALKEALVQPSTETIGGMSFLKGQLEGHDVVIVRSGIGKVNAAACTQLLIALYHVSHVINTGIAGSLNAAINIGDIVLSVDAIQHDVDATAFGYPLGEVPRVGMLAFQADIGLLSLAEEQNRLVNPDIQTFRGRVLSGDQFISSRTKKEALVKQFGGDCCEMEGAAIAQICALNEVPFLIIRAISDKADDSASVDYPSFEKKAIEHCVRLTKALTSKIKTGNA